MNHYFGPFIWQSRNVSGEERFFYGPPAGAWKRIVLGKVTGVPWGLFSGSGTLPAPYTLVGTDDPTVGRVGVVPATEWNATLGTSIDGSLSLVEAVRDTITLVPGRDRRVKLYIARNLVSDEPLAVLRADRRSRFLGVIGRQYRAAREDVVAGRSNVLHHRKVLSTLADKVFGRGDWTIEQARSLIPGDLPQEDPIDPSTTLSDDFTYSNGDLETTTSGQWVKTGGSGSLDISSNAVVRNSGTENRYRYETDVSSADHYCTMERSGGSLGPCVRYSASADTCYSLDVSGGAVYVLQSIVAGSIVTVDSGDFGASADAERKLTFEGTTYTLTDPVAGDYDTGTDATIEVGTRGGIYFDNATAAGDNWGMADLAASFTWQQLAVNQVPILPGIEVTEYH